MRICKELGVPLALEKIEGPATSLPFLGIILDSSKMEARLSRDKLMCIQEELTSWQGKKKATKWQIFSLAGSLHHTAKVVYYARTFVSRMYAIATKVRNWTTSPDWTWSFIQISYGGTLSSSHGMDIVYSDGIPFNTPSPPLSRLMYLEQWGVGPCLETFGFNGNGPLNGNHSP